LLSANDTLAPKEIKTLGQYLDGYLNRKIVLDYYFWQRSATLCNLNDDEVESHIQDIKSKIMS
jgi:hypothetical protein